MPAQGIKGLFTDVVLYFAGIYPGNFRVNTDVDEEFSQQSVPLIDLGCDCHPGISQRDEPAAFHDGEEIEFFC